ncbi:hypothetical protein C8R43DRAFT_893064 [Mycena crocata]|nr:hypothetical protein C8R43DRAFT_893064 [Mycena crocata]
MRNKSIRIPAVPIQSALQALATACLAGVQGVPRDQKLVIKCKKPMVHVAMTKHLPAMEDKGWIGIASRDPLRALAAELKARTAPTIFESNRSTGSQVGEGWAGAAALAFDGTRNPTQTIIGLEIEAHLELRGAKLSTLTQATAYAGIRELKAATSRKATENSIKQVQLATRAEFHFLPSPAQIWTSIRCKDFSRQAKNFYWKSMHAAHRIGTFWKHIPECEERGICQFCNETEDLEHITLKCWRPGQAQVWALARELWLKKHTDWPEITLGSILGCGLATFKDEKGRKLPGTTRLYRILISESFFEIWKIRNTTVIKQGGEPLSENHIHNRWLTVMNRRLQFDCNLTNFAKYGKQSSVSPLLVTQTWSSVLLNEEELPEDWIRQPRVLVGIEPRSSRPPPRPSGRRRGR